MEIEYHHKIWTHTCYDYQYNDPTMTIKSKKLSYKLTLKENIKKNQEKYIHQKFNITEDPNDNESDINVDSETEEDNDAHKSTKRSRKKL